MSDRRDAGHAPLIIIIVVIAVAILGLLGWLFWSNFINKPQTSADIKNFAQCKAATGSKILETFPEQCVTADGRTFTDSGASTGDEVAVKTYCTEAEKICFEYPENWTIDKLEASNGEPGYKADLVKIAAPDKKIVLTLESGIGGLGGNCPDENKVAVTVLDPTPAASLSGYADDFNMDVPHVARAAYLRDGAYTAAVYLTTSEEYTVPGVIQACGLGFSQFFAGRHSVLSNDFSGAGSMTFGYDSLDGDNVATYATLDEAKTAFESDVYKQAAAVLASAHYE